MWKIDFNVFVTNRGLNQITIDESDNSRYSIVYYTIPDGLPSNEINDIAKIDEVIWLLLPIKALFLSNSASSIRTHSLLPYISKAFP
ncbi:MAG: hypothetical protein R2764_01065 [Bacteroidales bacterium]